MVTPDELRRITAELPAPLRVVLLRLAPIPYRRRERLVFGTR